MNVEDLRISKLRMYLFDIINTLTTNRNYQINANMLSNQIEDYSLDKIPTASVVETWITGDEIHKDVYSFRSRKSYSQDTIVNLKNMGFFEQFEHAIKDNNKKGVLPDIEGIESIECLNCATMNSTDGKQAEFDIQIQITYRYYETDEPMSL
jgi:hypothetical protein